jgi:peptide-methionine (S)-S-oxide reductase
MSTSNFELAYFATGCFWGAERRFWSLPGVNSTQVGYMGGIKANPTYEEVCTGRTLHTEMVEITFNPTQISYESLCREFWVMHDPTSLNRQGGDIGTQYRSSIFFTSEQQRDIAFGTRDRYQSALTHDGIGEIVTEILDATGIVFYPAEQYHQRYLEKNPNGYDCHSSTGTAFPL